jgi:hypothetical protein
MKPKTKRTVARRAATAPQGATAPGASADLALPHERDQSTERELGALDPAMAQAKRDLDAGMVDTDMRATPSLDHHQRAGMVPGAGGKPPSSRR